MSQAARIRPKDRDAIVQSLRAGVVPRTGQQHIQVGRAEEVKALLQDIDRIADGGSSIRFVIGEYGSGKTFFLHLIRSIALEKKLVTAHADLTPDRRLHATGGQARTLYAELMRNLATRTKPEGGGLPSVIERFVATALEEGRERSVSPEVVIRERLGQLSEMVGGYDFAEVVAAYWRGHDTGDETLKSNAIRWLRGEFTTKTDARTALGVRTIVEDSNVYDQLKLFARFVRLAGFGGLVVCLDELVNLYKLANSRARNSNYEQLLRILNDSLQGISVGLGFLLGGTPEFLLDTRKGLYSYQALQSRLAENTYAVGGLVDYSGPVLRLANLTPEDFFVLIGKIRHVYASGHPSAYLLPDEGLQAFMAHCSKRIGDAYFRTPRSTISAFVNLLAVLEQNPGASWQELLGQVRILPDSNPDLAPLPEDDASASEASPSSDPPVSADAPPSTTPLGSAQAPEPAGSSVRSASSYQPAAPDSPAIAPDAPVAVQPPPSSEAAASPPTSAPDASVSAPPAVPAAASADQSSASAASDPPSSSPDVPSAQPTEPLVSSAPPQPEASSTAPTSPALPAQPHAEALSPKASSSSSKKTKAPAPARGKPRAQPEIDDDELASFKL